MIFKTLVDLYYVEKGSSVHILFKSMGRFERRIRTSSVPLSDSQLRDLVDDNIRYWLNDELISLDDLVRS